MQGSLLLKEILVKSQNESPAIYSLAKFDAYTINVWMFYTEGLSLNSIAVCRFSDAVLCSRPQSFSFRECLHNPCNKGKM